MTGIGVRVGDTRGLAMAFDSERHTTAIKVVTAGRRFMDFVSSVQFSSGSDQHVLRYPLSVFRMAIRLGSLSILCRRSGVVTPGVTGSVTSAVTGSATLGGVMISYP